MEMNMTQIPSNYKNNVDWVLGAYEDSGISFPNGFQKDAIQNAIGASKHHNLKGLKCEFSYIDNKNGTFLVVEDSGTVGLTGKNTPMSEINRIMESGKKIPGEERLSNFTSMYNSGNTFTGAGLYGVGKSVYSVASNTYTYYFDSLRDDDKYVANVNKRGQVYSLAFENEEAKTFIYEHTGLREKTSTGTRIIIEDPKKELIESIKSDEFVAYIQESWWRIILRMTGDSGIYVNGIRVSVPEEIMNNATHYFELKSPVLYTAGYTIKHFGFYVFENGTNLWSGISYYRRGMKIGDIDIKDIPQKLEGKFWGYIEVEKEWEDELSSIENRIHFGVNKGKKNTIQYRYLKNFCDSEVNKHLIDWGYVKDQENADKKLKNELQSIAEDVQDLFDKLGFENLGSGAQKPDFDVRWQNIRYPEINSENVTSGDQISFTIRIKSSYTIKKGFEYKLYIVNPKNSTVISQIETNKITIEPNNVFTKDFVFTVNKENSERFSENRIILSVKVTNSGKEKRKELPYFYDTEKPNNSRDTVNLTLHECTFPTQGSRRVNFGESLKNICYLIENKRNAKLSYKLDIYITDPSQQNIKIVDVASFEGTVDPFEDEITPYIKEIAFDQKTYGRFLKQGILELRARLASAADDIQFEKGDKITIYSYKVYINMDEKNGKFNSFDVESIDDKESPRRSWYVPGNGRKIVINVGHAAYSNLDDYPDVQHEYLREQMMKQLILLYLAEGKYDMFNKQEVVFSELDPNAAVEQVMDKIENVYYQSLT